VTAWKLKKLTPTGKSDGRQGQRHPEPDRVEDVGDIGDEEAVVLEDGQDAEIEDHAAGREPLPQPLVLGAVDRHHGQLADQRDRGEQQAEARVRSRVEDVARDRL